MSQYSYAEIMKMQHDAARRVEAMQRRSQEATAPGTVVKEPARHIPMPDGYLDKLRHEPSAPPAGTEQTGAGTVLGVPHPDPDTALLLSVILLLAEEGADETLLLALLYMLT